MATSEQGRHCHPITIYLRCAARGRLGLEETSGEFCSTHPIRQPSRLAFTKKSISRFRTSPVRLMGVVDTKNDIQNTRSARILYIGRRVAPVDILRTRCACTSYINRFTKYYSTQAALGFVTHREPAAR
jgi:hypothetical protein